jgi:hypothetical protein
MGDFDHNRDGLVDMRIDGTAQGVGELRAHADTLAVRLTAAFAEINDLTGKLGKGGTMSDQFMAQYGKWRADLDKGVDEVPVNYRKIADSGDAAVGTYRAAEQNASGGFRS